MSLYHSLCTAPFKSIMQLFEQFESANFLACLLCFLQIYNTSCGTHVSNKCTFSQMCSLVLQVHQLHCHLCFQDNHQQESSLNYNPESVHMTPYASFLNIYIVLIFIALVVPCAKISLIGGIRKELFGNSHSYPCICH